MKNQPLFKMALRAFLTMMAVMSFVAVSSAHPYASAVTNNAGTISFILNEAATSVSINLTNPGTGQTATIAGATTMGVQSFSTTQAGTTYTTYAITVFKNGSGVPSQISLPAGTGAGQTVYADYFGPRGVAVNMNPATHNFGRIYVCNANGSATSDGVRINSRGMYAVNADLSDAVGHGNVGYPTSGITWGGSTTYGPYKAFVGSDDTVYVTDANNTILGTVATFGTGTLYALDPDLVTPSTIFKYGLGGTTNFGTVIGRPIVTGSLAQGNLDVKAMMFTYPTAGVYLNVYDYAINNGPLPWNSAPTIAVPNVGTSAIDGVNGVISGMYPAPDGKIFIVLERGTSTGGVIAANSSLWVYSSTGTYLFDSSTAIGNTNTTTATSGANTFGDPFVLSYDVAVSPDGNFVATMNNSGTFILCHLTNGIPDLSTCTTNATSIGTGARGIAFDAADNVVVCSGGNDYMKVYSLGMISTAITGGDTSNPTPGNNDGTFSFAISGFTVATTASPASQGGFNGTTGTPIPGTITISRTGPDVSPVTVFFTMSGTATNSVYTATSGASTFQSTNGAGKFITNSLTFAAGQTSADITITPVSDNIPRPTTTVIVTLLTNANYSLYQATPSATLPIVNTGPQQLVVSGTAPFPNMYKGLTNDYAGFTITRLGDSNAPSYTVTNFTYSGAIPNVDFTVPARTIPGGAAGSYPLQIGTGVTINPGDLSVTATITPLQTSTAYTGNKVLKIGVAADPSVGYTVLGTTTASLTIIDNAYPTAPVLFSDALSNPIDANNNDGSAAWNIVFVNTNTTVIPFNPQYAQFGYDLIAAPDGELVGLPPNGSRTVLKVTANKGTVGASSAINLYPTNVSFSGNFAMRFNMLIDQGAIVASSTEAAMFGIDHSGIATNWFLGDYGSTNLLVNGKTANGGTGPWEIDGVWYAINADANSTTWGDYVSLSGGGTNLQLGYVPIGFGAANSGPATNHNVGGKSYTTFATAFKNAYAPIPGPYNADPTVTNPSGLPVDTDRFNTASAWADVEVKQINNVITMSINKTTIFTYVNTNLFNYGQIAGGVTNAPMGTPYISTQGTVMLGYLDPFASIGGSLGTGGAAYFSNLRVVQLGTLTINSINLVAGKVVINFSSQDGDDTTSSFGVLSSGTTGSATTVDTAVTGVTFTQLTDGSFQASFTQPGTSAVFYRIKHL